MAKYYLIGPEPGTNLLKEEDGLVYVLDKDDKWGLSPDAISYIYGEPSTEPVDAATAKEAFARITGGKTWTP